MKTAIIIRRNIGWCILLILGGCTTQSEKQPHVLHVVEIRQMQFQPAQLDVQKGDTVVFINHDIVAHNVTEQDKAWASPTLPNDSSWKWIASQSADYYCSLHPVMKGKVVVE